MRQFVAVVVLSLWPSLVGAAEPRVLLEGATLELIAYEPEVVTPIGMAFDQQGRLLVVESHTHQRPADYAGPKGDRIRMFSDSDGDGRLDRWSTFAEGYQQAMNLCAHPDRGIYLVTRRDVRLLEDTDDNGISDKETMILRLETEGTYPHNGLSGIAISRPLQGDAPARGLLIGLGENFGLPYKLVGSEGRVLEGSGGVGTIFVCSLDGKKLLRHATGFWNPFSICVPSVTSKRGWMHVFCVDNDPDSSPPCRLLDVLPAGDYGHRWEYGRAGVHPLQAWDGDLPGTLRMACGVGEAPTALFAHRGRLWVTSWGDHRLECYTAYTTNRHKASLEIVRTPGMTDVEHDDAITRASQSARLEVAVQGDADFRPTGAAVAPDGSIYIADWVSKSYPVHGFGRIWRLTIPSELPAFVDDDDKSDGPMAWDLWKPEAGLDQFFISDNNELATPMLKLQAARWHRDADPLAILPAALTDADPDVRLYAVRWIADERIKELRDDLAKLLDGEIPSERYFLAVIAAVEWLDGDASPRSGGISDGLLRRELANENRSPTLKSIALRLISPDHEWLTVDRLREYLASENPELRREAVRTIAMQTRPERFSVLAEIANDAAREPRMRADAVVGLAADVANQEALLTSLAEGDEPTVAREAARVLRLNRKRADAAEGVPTATDLDAWSSLLGEGGDAESGRRLFFMAAGPQCAACHQHSGRGGRIGPDLTLLGEQQARERIIASILQPSREIAPHYQAWELRTTGGLTRVGLRLPKGGDDGIEPYADSTGKRFELRSEEIELRSPAEASIMPEGLAASLTVEDLRDLVAFLSAKK
jgi:putative membrane-bound dehydrogenase-like protein